MAERSHKPVPLRQEEAVLRTLGLEEVEAKAYARLMTKPLSAPELGAELSLGVPTATKVLNGLVSRGLANRLPGRESRFGLIAPEFTLPVLLRTRQEEIARSQTVVESLVARHRDAAATARQEYVEIVMGTEGLRSQFESLQRAAKREILGCTKLPILLTSIGGGNPGEEAALSMGVSNRWIYEAEVLEQPGAMAAVLRFAEQGEESRVLPSLPSKMTIVDRETALLHVTEPGVEGRQVVGVVMRHPELVETLLRVFELLWAQATPIGPSAAFPTQPSGEAELIQCLVAGMTDEAIARQLGVSKRTVGRRVSELMVRMQARSRFQAGFLFARDET
jgi:predicted transcriptional regulator